MTSTKPSPVSILSGYVRIGLADNWADATALLRKDIEASYARTMASPLRRQRMEHELGQVSAGPVNGLLVTSGSWAWADSLRYAQEGAHGLTAGSLAYVRDMSNGSGDYTIRVKVKILAVDGRRVTVRVTGDSIQFGRGDVVTVWASSIAPRAK